MARGKLRREIDLVLLIAIIIGLNVGGSLFVLTGIAADLTGPSLFIAQIISVLPVLLALIPYMTLTSAIPATCASYQYAKLFSFPLAVAAWMVLFVAIPIGALPLFVISTGKFLQVLIPGLPLIAAAIITMTLFYLTNMIGIKPTALCTACYSGSTTYSTFHLHCSRYARNKSPEPDTDVPRRSDGAYCCFSNFVHIMRWRPIWYRNW